MLKKITEWYRTVDPDPKDDTIEKRRASADEFVKAMTNDAKSVKGLLPLIATVVSGPEKDNKAVGSLIEAIRQHQPSFVGDPTGNALELRVFGALALGEVLDRKGPFASDIEVAASLLVAALSIPPSAPQRHLDRVFTDLLQLAHETIQSYAFARRKRSLTSLPPFDRIAAPAPPDAPNWAKAIYTPIKASLDAIQEQAISDREELEVLWWMFNGYSDRAKAFFSDLSPSTTAMTAGSELARLVIAPATESVRQMVRRMVLARSPEEARSPTSITVLVTSCPEATLQLIAPDTSAARELTRDHPTVLPVTWLCRRLLESERSPGWEKEFERKTRISPTADLLPLVDWAVQVFNEGIAVRLFETWAH
jgi:hypothetical protein